jgi:hypothetical protein
MKKAVFLCMLVVGLLAGIVATACGGGGETAKALPPLEWGAMNLIPKDAIAGSYVDFASLRGDEDLQDIYSSYITEFTASEFQGIGIDPSNIDYGVTVQNASGIAGIVHGHFDSENIRGNLSKSGLTQSRPQGFEVWSGNYGEFGQMTMAILVDGVIFGEKDSPMALISTINDKNSSLFETTEAKELLAYIPTWTPLITVVSRRAPDNSDISGVELMTYAFAKEDKDTLKFESVIKFVDLTAAQTMEAPAIGMWEELGGATQVKARQEGSLVIIEGKLPIWGMFHVL